MARVIWRYTLTKQEAKLWETEELRGWREAMQGFVEDEAREQGCKKFAIYGRDDCLIVKDEVTLLAEPVEADA
ncbi:MAG: hypothetical protein KAH38_03850 [Candidatus Hydrogenedentes bacterium]|nr:hypothetical protein [Candidatus Hydrogenedentota bacterium]